MLRFQSNLTGYLAAKEYLSTLDKLTDFTPPGGTSSIYPLIAYANQITDDLFSVGQSVYLIATNQIGSIEKITNGLCKISQMGTVPIEEIRTASPMDILLYSIR